ncbi:Protein of unknown function [Chryseolinea serpens]|uniref:DUF3500 domain-containing protein n=2 Tax=Chryseolinea serpens TaxID=947013 RepID=A0A1M5RDT8_9BACT|nr:Protein of unknown function [Chryseolinea serpens]
MRKNHITMKIGNSRKLIPFLLLIAAMSSIQVCYGQGLTTIVAATNNFLKTLNPEELKATQFSFTDSLRIKWSNFPVGMVPRAGIRYGTLGDQSRVAFHDMLSTFLSSQGYLKVTGIMQLDDILNILSQQAFDQGKMSAGQLKNILEKLGWGYDNYFISIWGTPNEKEPWGFSLGGHHMALSLTMRGKDISFTPMFVGTDPAQIQTAKYAGWRVLSKEEDYGFLLLGFLSKAQKAKAILTQATPKDIITNPESSQRITTYSGIAAKEFNADQLEVFKILIQEYLHNFEHDVAHGLYDKIVKTGFDKVYFAWIGGEQRHTPHYYIINGPDFLIEYDNVGFQNDGNHIHAILRQKDNDFGSDILKDHYLNSDHHKK